MVKSVNNPQHARGLGKISGFVFLQQDIKHLAIFSHQIWTLLKIQNQYEDLLYKQGSKNVITLLYNQEVPIGLPFKGNIVRGTNFNFRSDNRKTIIRTIRAQNYKITCDIIKLWVRFLPNLSYETLPQALNPVPI